MVKATKTLEQILLEGKFLTEEALRAAKAEIGSTGEKLGRVLIRRRDITPETLSAISGFCFNILIVEKLEDVQVEEEAKNLIPADVAKRCNVFPLAANGDTLTVIIEDPWDAETLEVLRALAKKRIKSVLASEGWQGIQKKIEEVYG